MIALKAQNYLYVLSTSSDLLDLELPCLKCPFFKRHFLLNNSFYVLERKAEDDAFPPQCFHHFIWSRRCSLNCRKSALPQKYYTTWAYPLLPRSSYCQSLALGLLWISSHFSWSECTFSLQGLWPCKSCIYSPLL